MLALPHQASAQTTPLGEELRAAVSRAGELRAMAADFDAASYFPSEWASAEAAHTEAGLTTDEAGAIAAHNLAADSFESILRLSLSLYAQAREDEITAIRRGLTENGARAFFPELAGRADRAALEAWDLYEAGNYGDARIGAEQALSMFQILETGFAAWQRRREIVLMGLGFSDTAKDNLERADEIMGDAVHAYNAGDFSLAMENAIEAHARYSLLVSSGWTGLAQHRASTAEAERLAAVEIRGNVARKDIFEQADLIYVTALDLLRREHYMEAASQFEKATSLYSLAISSTLRLRDIAASTIMEANLKIDGRAADPQIESEIESARPTLEQHMESIRRLEDMIRAAREAKSNEN